MPGGGLQPRPKRLMLRLSLKNYWNRYSR
jgi:hypothetical protein